MVATGLSGRRNLIVIRISVKSNIRKLNLTRRFNPSFCIYRKNYFFTLFSQSL